MHQDRQEMLIAEVVISMQLAMTEVDVCSRLQYKILKCIIPLIASHQQAPGPRVDCLYLPVLLHYSVAGRLTNQATVHYSVNKHFKECWLIS